VVLQLVSWNVGRRDLWSYLEPLDADVALLQEVRRPEPNGRIELSPDLERRGRLLVDHLDPWRTAIGRLSDRVELLPRPTVGVHGMTGPDDWAVCPDGSITVADVMVDGAFAITAVSVYAAWEMTPSRLGYADASAHRILSDLSILMGKRRHRLVVAGDWNILRGYGEYGSAFWKTRYATVFDRAEILGLRFVGPSYPNGRQAEPWPDELPQDSLCVPTFHHSQQRPKPRVNSTSSSFLSPSPTAWRYER
jgi:hypothetical protein